MNNLLLKNSGKTEEPIFVVGNCGMGAIHNEQKCFTLLEKVPHFNIPKKFARCVLISSSNYLPENKGQCQKSGLRIHNIQDKTPDT